MSAIEILAVVGIIGFIIFKQVKGEALHGKRAVLLPAILTVIGFTDLHASNGARLQSADIACIVVGCIGSVLIGLAFGAITRLESRGGYLWAQLPVYGLWLWAAMFGWRVAVMVVASGMHAHVAASSSTLLFSLGLNRLAQAAVIVPRAMAMGVPFAPEKDGSTFLAGLFDRNAAQASPDGDGYPPRGVYRQRDAYDGAEVRDREEYEHSGYDRNRNAYGRTAYDGGPVDLGRGQGGGPVDLGRGQGGGPVDLGRGFGRDGVRDGGDYDRDRRNDWDRDGDRDDRQDRDRDRRDHDRRDRDGRQDRVRDRDRRHDRDRRRDRFGDRW